MADGDSLYLIRHLPTEGNRRKQYIGWTDEPILHSESEALRLLGVTSVHGSDLLRCRQTAAIYFPGAHYAADARWRECHFGDFEGKTYALLEQDTDYRNWIDDPYRFAARGGESLQEVEERVLQAVAELPSGAAAVTHGGPIRVCLSHFSQDVRPFWSWDAPHGSVYRMTWAHAADRKEGRPCASISAVPITASGSTSAR